MSLDVTRSGSTKSSEVATRGTVGAGTFGGGDWVLGEAEEAEEAEGGWQMPCGNVGDGGRGGADKLE